MKGVIVSLCIAAGIVAGSLAYTHHLERVSDELGKINEEIAAALDDEDYTAASENADKLSDCLDSKRTSLAATGNHEELDKIEMNLAQMKSFIESEHKADALSCCETLSFLFEHLPKNYELKIENIL